MSVMSLGMTRLLKLELDPLGEVGLQGCSIRTAESCGTVLQYWVWLVIGVEGIWRSIRCFVAPGVVSITDEGRSEYLSIILPSRCRPRFTTLMTVVVEFVPNGTWEAWRRKSTEHLGHPWNCDRRRRLRINRLFLGIPRLYTVNASISIRLSTIFILDLSIREEIEDVVDPEMVFGQDQHFIASHCITPPTEVGSATSLKSLQRASLRYSIFLRLPQAISSILIT